MPMTLELQEDFWSSKIGSTIAAFMAMDSIVEPVAKALYSLPSSETKDFPVLPYRDL